MQAHNAPTRARRREIPWVYLLPVAGAPIAHVFVSATKNTQSLKVKRWLLGGVVLSTVTMVFNRLWLMEDAWNHEKPRYAEDSYA